MQIIFSFLSHVKRLRNLKIVEPCARDWMGPIFPHAESMLMFESVYRLLTTIDKVW